MLRALPAIALALVASCASTSKAPVSAASPPPAQEPEARAPDAPTSAPSSIPTSMASTPPLPPEPEAGAILYPPPFSARAIREATHEGRIYRFRTTTVDGVSERTAEFRDVTEDGARVIGQNFGPDGASMGAPTAAVLSWAELESHATYQAEHTRVEVTEVTVPAGTYSAWQYIIEESTEEGLRVTRAWFAPELPGAPVKHVVELDGTVRTTMELVSHENPEPLPDVDPEVSE